MSGRVQWLQNGRLLAEGVIVREVPAQMMDAKTGERYAGVRFVIREDDGHEVETCAFRARPQVAGSDPMLGEGEG